MKIWKYNRCGSCRKAVKYLDENGLDYTALEILETPPTAQDLKEMLNYLDGNIKKLFNTSGVKYREGNYKDIVKTLSAEEAFKLLASEGALIKRPFILGDNVGIVGFKEEVYNELFKNN